MSLMYFYCLINKRSMLNVEIKYILMDAVLKKFLYYYYN
jgi:hypothetical protein